MHTLPDAARSATSAGKYSWVMSPRWFDGKDHLALDTGGGPLARLWSTALSGLVDMAATSRRPAAACRSTCPRARSAGPASFEWKIPKWSNTLERNRARTYFQAYAAAAALHFLDKAFDELRRRAGRGPWEPFTVPDEAIGCGFTEAVRGVLSHHIVIRDGKIANYHPWPPTPWNGNPRDSYGTPGRTRTPSKNTPIFEENGPDNFKGIDIMRAVRSFDPCLAVRRAHVSRRRQNARDRSLAAGTLRVTRPHGIDESPYTSTSTAADGRIASGNCSRGSMRLGCRASARERGGTGRTVVGLYGTVSRGPHGRARDASASVRSRDLRAAVADPFVESLLCLHGLHPVPVEERVAAALHSVLPYFRIASRRHHGSPASKAASLLLQLEGSCDGCASSTATVKLAVEKAIRDRVPEIHEVRAVGAVPAAAPRATLKRESDWISLDSLRGLSAAPDSGIAAREVEGTPILFVRFCDTVYAYRNACPACSKPLDGAHLARPLVTCNACGFAFDVIHAGRPRGGSGPSAEPFPLAIENGRARVAIPIGA